jgi:hypothetical protein
LKDVIRIQAIRNLLRSLATAITQAGASLEVRAAANVKQSTFARVSVSRPSAPKTPPEGGPPSYPRGPPTGGDCLPVPSVGSPASPAPSPLPTPHSEPPASIPPQDVQQSATGLSPQAQQSTSQPASSAAQPPLTPSQVSSNYQLSGKPRDSRSIRICATIIEKYSRA